MVPRNSWHTVSCGEDGDEIARCWFVEVIAGPDAGKSALWALGSRTIGTHPETDLTLFDPAVSRRHVRLELLEDTVWVTDLESKNGTYLASKRIDRTQAGDESVIRIGGTRIRLSARSIDEQQEKAPSLDAFITEHPQLQRALAQLASVAKTDVTVLLEGESGTGKRTLAHAIHEASLRAGKPIVIAAGDVPEAIDRAGGGTLVAVGLASMERTDQSAILRLLEEPRRVVRLIVTEEKDPIEKVRAGKISEELYYRIAIVRARIPPLRERPEDVAPLSRLFLMRSGGARSALSSTALEFLKSRVWPNNARELEHLLARAVACSRGAEICPEDLVSDGTTQEERPFHLAKEAVLQDFERQYVESMLSRHDGNVSHAAKKAQLTRGSFYALMKRATGA